MSQREQNFGKLLYMTFYDPKIFDKKLFTYNICVFSFSIDRKPLKESVMICSKYFFMF